MKQIVGIQQVKAKLGQSVNKTRKGKVLHGQYIRSVDRQLVGGEDTLLWLLRGDMKGSGSTSSDNSNRILCDINITNTIREQM